MARHAVNGRRIYGPPVDVSSEPALQPEARTVESADGTPIHYDLYRAPSDKLVLVVPGFWRTRRWPALFRLAKFLNTEGFQVAIVDVRGHGDSGGKYTFNLHEHEDVYAVARELQNELALAGIGVIGLSIGGAISVCTVAKHPDIRWQALILISAVAKFAMIRPHLNPFVFLRQLSARAAVRVPRFTWRFFISGKLCAADEIASVHVPVSIIHFRDDWLIHHRHGELLYRKANEPKEWTLIDREGRYHADRLLMVAPDILEEKFRDFLRRTMR